MVSTLATLLPSPAPRRIRFWWLYLLLSFLLLLAILFANLGRWLIREDSLQKASAIAVLSGRMPSRVLEAAKLYRAGYAPEVWLTYSEEPAADLKRYGIQFQGEDYYNKQILLGEGVPESAIRILTPPIVNTADEMQTIAATLASQPGRSVILVTSKVHTRRTAFLWRHLASPAGIAIVRGVSDDEFDAAHWWRNTTDVLDVVREVLGLVNAAAGLPLRPAKSPH